MAWAKPAFMRRFAITFDNVTGGGVGTVDIDFTIPETFDTFWDNILGSGNDILITEGDGITLIQFANGNCTGWDLGTSFSKTSKTGSIRIDGWTNAGGSVHPPVLDAMGVIWVYYNQPNQVSGFTDGVVGALTPRASSHGEEHPLRAKPRLTTAPELVDTIVPRNRFPHTTNETSYLYWDYSRELNISFGNIQGRRRLEEVKAFELDAESGDSDEASVVDETSSLFMDADVIRTVQTGGRDGTDYTLKLKMHTTLGRVLERRAILAARNPKD